MKLEEVTTGASLEGVEPSSVVSVVAAIAIPRTALQLINRLSGIESAADEVPETKPQLDLFGGKA